MVRYLPHLVICLSAVSTLQAPAPAAGETSAQVLADQLRSQGYACDRVLGAERNVDVSRPDEAVWVLKCSNGKYRMRLVPDMAAKIERID